jgi:hypothetical protein
MRIHELLDQALTDYLQQLSEDFSLDEVSWYRYKPTAKLQLNRAMLVARKTTSRIKKTGCKVKSVAKRAGRSAAKAAAANAMKQQAVQKQKQTAKAPQAATAYQPIKYPKQMVMPRKQHVAQPQPVAAPPSITTKVSNLSDLQNLGAQAHRLLPNDKRGTPPWELHND